MTSTTARTAVFLTCFLSLWSQGLMAGSVVLRLRNPSANSTYLGIYFTAGDLENLYSCMSKNTTLTCSIVVIPPEGQELYVIEIIPTEAGVNDALSYYYTCSYRPEVRNVMCNRSHTTACEPQQLHTLFRLQDPCCLHTCVGFVWNDAQEQLINQNDAIEICNATCMSVTNNPEMASTTKTAALLNETNPWQPTTDRVGTHAGNSTYDHNPSVIVGVVLASIIVVIIIIIIVVMCYKRCRGREHKGDIKTRENQLTDTNTGSFRTLAADLPTEYVNTNQARVYSSLDFVDGVALDHHAYVPLESSCKSQHNADECENNKQNIYEDFGKPNLGPTKINNISSLGISNNKQHINTDRTYSTIADSYAILEDLKDDSAEVDRPSINRSSTAKYTYIDLNDETTDDIYIKADTDMRGDIHTYDSNIGDTEIYANTKSCAPEDSQFSDVRVGDSTEYTNLSGGRITIRM